MTSSRCDPSRILPEAVAHWVALPLANRGYAAEGLDMHSCMLSACGKAYPEGYKGFFARVLVSRCVCGCMFWGCAANGIGKLALAGPWVCPDLMALALCLAAY